MLSYTQKTEVLIIIISCNLLKHKNEEVIFLLMVTLAFESCQPCEQKCEFVEGQEVNIFSGVYSRMSNHSVKGLGEGINKYEAKDQES